MFSSLPDPTSATHSQPLGNSYSEKIQHFIFLNEISQLAAGMTYIQVQLLINITAMHHQNEIIKANLNRIKSTELESKIPQALNKAIKNLEFFHRRLNRKMDKLRNVVKNLPNGRILTKHSPREPLYQLPIEDVEKLILDDYLKLELVNRFLFNLRGENNSISNDFFIHFRDKQQIKENFNVANIHFGNFYSS
jgi:hypothetical protein